MSKNLFETYEVNGRTYTDNLGTNAMINIPKKQFIEYEQQKEEIEKLNRMLDRAIDMSTNREEKLESLKQINEEHKKINGELRVENERLNNIINEFEDWLIRNKRTCKRYNNEIGDGIINIISNKLNELKGSDK